MATPEEVEQFLLLFDGDREAAIRAIRSQSEHHKICLTSKPNMAPVSGDPIIAVKELTMHYKVGRQRVDALAGVSCTVQEGEFVAITGASGSGKSTLLQLMGGLDRPSSGTVIVGGVELGKLRDSELSRFRSRTVGFVFQSFYLQPFLALERNLEVPGMFLRAGRKARRSRAAELAETVGLTERLQHLPKELSGGQIQRAAVARALFNNPKILLADEPTGNLDSRNSAAIIEEFESIRRRFNTTVVVATHDQSIASRADRIIRLKDGKVQ